MSDFKKLYLKSQIELIKTSKIDSLTFFRFHNAKKNNQENNIFKNIISGDYHLFKKFPEDSLATFFYQKALTSSIEIKDTLLISETYKKILFQLSQNRGASDVSLNYLNSYKKYLYDLHEKSIYLFYVSTAKAIVENKEKIEDLKKGLLLVNRTSNRFLKAKYNQMIGVYYSHFKKENDSALFYMQKAKELLEVKNYQLFKNELFGVYGNIGQYIEKKGDLFLANTYYEKATKIKVPKYRYLVKVKLNEILSNNAL